MKKFLCFCLLTFMIAAVFAEGQTFEKLGKYKEVKVVNITRLGIRIKHSQGSCYITDKHLSKNEQKLLEKELKIWREKLEKYNIRRGAQKKNRAAQEAELAAFMKQLPKMNIKAINTWCQHNIETSPYKSDFKLKFFTTYHFAKNNKQAWKACEKRLIELDTKDFNDLKTKCLGGMLSAADGLLKRKIGVPYRHKNGIHPSFSENLRVRYLWVPKNTRNAFIAALNKKMKEESTCCFCKKEKSIKPGGYCVKCKPKVCTKCDKALVEGNEKDNKEKICSSCKEEAAGGGDGGGDAPPAL